MKNVDSTEIKGKKYFCAIYALVMNRLKVRENGVCVRFLNCAYKITGPGSACSLQGTARLSGSQLVMADRLD